MKRFFIPLLAAFAMPTAVNAETWWLMAAGRLNQAAGTTAHRWAIPTNSEQECEFAGQKFLNGSYPYVIGEKARESLLSRIGVCSILFSTLYLY